MLLKISSELARSKMKQRESPGLPSRMDVEQDRFSYLPVHIIDKILCLLSIKDVVRTSLLSSKWRYKWVTLPDIVFDKQCMTNSSQDQTATKNKLVNIIDHVLLLHAGPINKFKLSHRDFVGVADIDRWILYLSRGSVKELILEIWKGPRYKLPSSLYCFQNLTHLEIFNCLLNPPSTFGGFRTLRSLDLQHVTLTQDVFERLISSCPLLERLTLMNFDGFMHLNIRAPNLQFFDIGGVFEDVSFENTSHLAIISIGLYVCVGNPQDLELGRSSNLVRFFSHLPHIQRLEVQSYFLKYLAVCGVPERLPHLCLDLNYLSIRMNFNDWGEKSAALCLLRSCVNLQELEMLARPDEQPVGTANFWGQDGHRDCPLKKLKLVRIVGISLGKPELDFINFVLANSPVLETMTIKPISGDGGWEFVKELLRSRRASVQARISYLDA